MGLEWVPHAAGLWGRRPVPVNVQHSSSGTLTLVFLHSVCQRTVGLALSLAWLDQCMSTAVYARFKLGPSILLLLVATLGAVFGDSHHACSMAQGPGWPGVGAWSQPHS